jgi:oligosaccharyl transferase (archaeosortase A-associated)
VIPLSIQKRSRTIFIIGVLIAFTIFTIWIRLLPYFHANLQDILSIVGSDDPLYNLRQIELMIQNYPVYPWFDAMTYFPYGNQVHWGSFFIYICSSICLLLGATSRPEIITTSLMVPALLAAVMVPVVYVLIERVTNWKAGLIGSFFITLIAGQYFFRSLFGYLDHHIAEVLFGTIFSLCFIVYLKFAQKNPPDIRKPESLKQILLLGALAGIAYVLGLLTMPTMILFALIVGIFTIIQFFDDFIRGTRSDYILICNCVIFGIAIIGFLAQGVKTEGLQLNTYSIGHPIAYAFLIIVTIVLYLFTRYMKGRHFAYYPLFIGGFSIAGLAIVAIAAPTVYNSLIGGLVEFFGQSPYYLTIQEARSWTLIEAWQTFGWGLVLTAGGILILAYRSIRERRADIHYLLIWSLIILISAWQHIRYEYYLAVNIAILSGICVGYAVDLSIQNFRTAIPEKAKAPSDQDKQKKGSPAKKKGSQKAKPSGPADRHFPIILLIAAVLLSIGFVYNELSVDLPIANQGLRMNGEWREALMWMETSTPDPGVDYTHIYDKSTYQYPPQAYGVMSWWDYGHQITYIAKRIPNANPFQEGVVGPNGGAAPYFMAQDEATANAILDNLKTRYVITDIEMDTLKFWAMATWFNSTAGAGPYQQNYLVPDQSNPDQYTPVLLYEKPYYTTMISRLHNLDGSMATPSNAIYVEYLQPDKDQPYPRITNGGSMNAAEAIARATQFNSNPPAGYGASVVNNAFFEPTVPVSALDHYRLVHESPTNILSGSSVDIKYVKVFEYVKGARLRGNGTIELPIITDAGRTFVYRQQSENGMFILPYSTTGNPYQVRPTGKYRVIETGAQYDVTEEAVQNGSRIG